jgi:hypothetical protein
MSGAMSARFSVDQEIEIQRQDDMAIMDFRHLADACIGQRHRHGLPTRLLVPFSQRRRYPPVSMCQQALTMLA